MTLNPHSLKIILLYPRIGNTSIEVAHNSSLLGHARPHARQSSSPDYGREVEKAIDLCQSTQPKEHCLPGAATPSQT
jgi:hypothetical protein